MRNLIVFLLFGILPLFAQDVLKLPSMQDIKIPKKASQLKPELTELEAPVDEDAYRIGPGDMFSIVIGGRLEEEQQVTVTPEGLLVLPAAGRLEVAGLTLREAKAKILAALSSKFLSHEIAVTLTQLRSFRVTVSGSVYYPGLVAVNAMTRVSDAVFLAGGIIVPPTLQTEPEDPRKQIPGTRKPKTEEKLSEEDQKKLEQQIGSQRNILVKRRDGSSLRADLLMYESAGVLDANPFLLDGDVIVVEPTQKQIGEAAIYGAVKTPGLYEYRPGDRVIDLLRLGRGFRLDADSSKIELTRFEPNGRTVTHFEIAVDWHNPTAALETPLEPDDRLYVRSIPNFHRKRTVEVRGEVKYPGEYPLLKSPAYLSEVIAAAGGFTPQAMLNGAYVQRRSMETRQDREFERLDYLIGTEMSATEKAYYRERMREMKGLVSVDFPALFLHGQKEADVILQDQDLIHVPAIENTVYVLGHVKKPGLVAYQEGKSASYYIQTAGGLNANAWRRRIKIQKAGTGELLPPGKTHVEMGDTILVPEQVEKDFWETFRDVAVVTTQIATMVMVITQINYWTSLRK